MAALDAKFKQQALWPIALLVILLRDSDGAKDSAIAKLARSPAAVSLKVNAPFYLCNIIASCKDQHVGTSQDQIVRIYKYI